MFSRHFFGVGSDSRAEYLRLLKITADALIENLPNGPYGGSSPEELRALLSQPELSADRGDPKQIMAQLAAIVRNSVALWHPGVVAHLHTPVLNIALAAELVISALNQSMDSFDQAPAATIIEQHMLTLLCGLCGLPESALGTFTAGGTQSNYMGLLLARDHFIERRWNWCTREKGLPPDHNRLRIICSDMAHFSVEKSAIQLGLGTHSVVKIPVDEQFRICLSALRDTLADLRRKDLEPFAIVATAGTTDFGSIDSLADIAEIANEHRNWLHVDAAYGGALLLSERRRSALAGIERANSITVDFHKAFFQPISCSAFLLANSEDFRFIRVHADYLNSESRQDEGIPDLVTNSVLTTRRFDALKLWLSMQTLGLREYGRMIDRLAELACFAADKLRSLPCFEVLHDPAFAAVVFRYVPIAAEAAIGAINSMLPQRLFSAGMAVLGHTVVRAQAYLKLTLSNPCTSFDELAGLIQQIEAAGTQLENEVLSPAVA